MESWAEVIVDRLAALRLTGWAFEECWRIALAENAPRGSEFRLRGPLTLLDDPADDPVEFLRRACRDAWEDRRPALRHLGTALEHHVEAPGSFRRDRSRPAPLSANVG